MIVLGLLWSVSDYMGLLFFLLDDVDEFLVMGGVCKCEDDVW